MFRPDGAICRYVAVMYIIKYKERWKRNIRKNETEGEINPDM
jgi:hypothetical protein